MNTMGEALELRPLALDLSLENDMRVEFYEINDVEMVKIRVDSDNVVVRKATDDDREVYSASYLKFKPEDVDVIESDEDDDDEEEPVKKKKKKGKSTNE